MVIVSIDEGNVQGWRKPCSTAVFPKAGDALQSPRDLKKKIGAWAPARYNVKSTGGAGAGLPAPWQRLSDSVCACAAQRQALRCRF